MNKVFLTLLFFLIAAFDLNAQQCEPCRLQFDELLKMKNKDILDSIDLKKSFDIASDLYSKRYIDYIDSVSGKTTYVSKSLTKTFADICINAGDSLGVSYYLKYMELTKGSVEEQRSFSLENLFVKYPVAALKKIYGNKDLMENLVWGFVNNRYYGAKDPNENEEFKAMTVYYDTPKPKLNKDNCKDIFFETNPSLRENYNEYKEEIDSIIELAILYLSN